MVLSEIRALYNDENDLLRTVVKHIYEDYDPERKWWTLKKVEYLFGYPEFPVLSDTPQISVKHRRSWLIPPDWEFITEEWEYTRQNIRELPRGYSYDYDSEVETPAEIVNIG